MIKEESLQSSILARDRDSSAMRSIAEVLHRDKKQAHLDENILHNERTSGSPLSSPFYFSFFKYFFYSHKIIYKQISKRGRVYIMNLITSS